MAIEHVNAENFQEEVLECGKTVLLDFWAEWCGPCRMIAPALEEIAQERTDIKVCKVNVDEAPELAMRYGIDSIPALMVIRKGEITRRAVGAMPKYQLLALLD